MLLFTLVTKTVFGQTSDLLLNTTDIRLENAYLNGSQNGYNLLVRKKIGIESVMLTESSGFHALRSIEWNAVNGNERRDISGVTLYGAYSRFSIVSSTPEPDDQYGKAFKLFIPSTVVYGNPTSSSGTVYMNITKGLQINIRTFDHKYADPNSGRFKDNKYILNIPKQNYPIPSPYDNFEYFLEPESSDRVDRTQHEPVMSLEPSFFDLDILRTELRVIILNKNFLTRMNDEELKRFLRRVFYEEERRK
jgi:hypothetical protein